MGGVEESREQFPGVIDEGMGRRKGGLCNKCVSGCLERAAGDRKEKRKASRTYTCCYTCGRGAHSSEISFFSSEKGETKRRERVVSVGALLSAGTTTTMPV